MPVASSMGGGYRMRDPVSAEVIRSDRTGRQGERGEADDGSEDARTGDSCGDVDLFDVVPVLAGEVVHAVDDAATVFGT